LTGATGMSFDDDLDPKKITARKKPLDNMSVTELRAYIDALKEEIARVEADIAKKEKTKNAADSFFKGA
jgi:uncharacterized small protein (DUF1192 family)